MKRTDMALIAVAALAVLGASIPAFAVPPTATPSPGYDARLQEQRAAQRTQVAPLVKPRRVKKPSAH